MIKIVIKFDSEDGVIGGVCVSSIGSIWHGHL